MSEVLRSTTFQIAFNGKDGITGITQMTKAVKDADATVDELNKTLGENATVTYNAVRSKKELTAEARAVVTQMERNARNTEKLTQHYQFLASTVGKTADEMQVLNAVQSLGSTATEAQRQQVAKAVTEFQHLTASQQGQQGSLRNSRGIMQQFGWQMQDTIVQLQMGTSAFVVLSQQGSQMAAAFGPTGAIVGAFIALTGVVAGSAAASVKATTAAKNLKDAEFELLPVLREKAAQYEYLEAAQLRYLRSQDADQLKLYTKQLNETEAKMFSLGRNYTNNTEKQKKNGVELERLRALQETLASRILETENRIRNYNTNLDTKTKREKESRDALESLIKSAQTEAEQLTLTDRAIALNTASKAKASQADYNRINAAYDLIEAHEKLTESDKDRAKQIAEVVRAFESEYLSLTKQTENVQQEYDRRKKIIDDYVNSQGKANDKARKAYADLNLWRSNELDKEYDTLAKSLLRKTDSVQESYDKQKKIIDDHVTRVGSVDTESAASYSALEQWKTSELQKEYDKREGIRKAIEKAQWTQQRRDTPVAGENDLFARNLMALGEQKKSLGEQELEERKRIDGLIEGEVGRHTAKIAEIGQQQLLSEMQTYSTYLGQLGTLFGQVSALAEQGSGAAEALFYINQAIAFANAIVSTEMAATKALELGPILGIPAATVVRGIGYASAGIIAGQTIAGAFDDGGNVPSGQLGIVAEYGDELVNGMLVQGPARVTSRKDTAELLNEAKGPSTSVSVNFTIENKIPGAQYSMQQIDSENVRMIAEQVFSQNIDQGVSNVISNPNTKASKSMRSNFNVNRKL